VARLQPDGIRIPRGRRLQRLPKKVSLKIGKDIREYEVIREPYPHILVSSRKELHGWWRGKRECTGERMLINPYNGCSVGCIFCYARALPAPYFRLFNDTGIVTVFKDFDSVIADQLESVRVASCGYLSPVCDPFQAVDSRYGLSEKIVREFVGRNIPIEFITKCVVPRSVIDLMKTQAHSFGQFSLSTPNESVRSNLMARGASVDELFSSMTGCAVSGLPVVLRIDPVIPYLTDSRNDLRQLVGKGIDSGAEHIIASVMDVPIKIAKEIFAKFKLLGVGFAYDLERIYSEQIDGYLHASVEYRKRIFDVLRNLCDTRGITFAVCMEYELVDGRPVGLNREFMSSENCEGADVPVYVKKAGRFVPAAACNGACLNCMEASCGIDDLAMGRGAGKTDFTLRDYRRWSRNLEGRDG
jgi:DNA repair photolyase